MPVLCHTCWSSGDAPPESLHDSHQEACEKLTRFGTLPWVVILHKISMGHCFAVSDEQMAEIDIVQDLYHVAENPDLLEKSRCKAPAAITKAIGPAA